MSLTLKQCIILMASIFGLICSINSAMAALKDPRYRDEDISHTQIDVQINKLSSGLYEYIYDVTSPAENKGKIMAFSIDVSCDLNFEPVIYPEPVDTDFSIGLVTDNNYLPVQLYNEPNFEAPIVISRDKRASWAIFLPPNDAVNRLRIHSPAPPGKRLFIIKPNWDTYGWDYAPYEQDMTIPRSGDFIVTGMITAPACAYAPPEEPPLYLGSRDEGDTINSLLSYSQPQRDRWHVSEDITEVELTIHYSDEIDPKTFKVQPGWARPFFSPVPGGLDTVTLPLKQAVNKFQFEVAPTKNKTPRKTDPLHHSLHDRDVFEIRRGVV